MKNSVDAIIKSIIITCGLLWLGTLGLQAALYLANRPVRGNEQTLRIQSYTNAEAGHFSITNMTNTPQYMCLRGVVANKLGTKAYSTPVCTGIIQPKSTVLIEARYTIGEVKELCKGDNALGIIDWDKCTFVYIEEDI
jgi:hypothetical protein